MKNSTDLIQLVSGLAEKLPQTEDDAGLTILPGALPGLPSTMETDQLVVTRGQHNYGTWRINYPQVSAPKSAYEALGVATAAVLLRPDLDELRIQLTNPKSEVRELRIAFSDAGKAPFGLHQAPVHFEYWPGPRRYVRGSRPRP